MRRIVKSLAVLLALMMLVPLTVSCKKDEPPVETEGTTDVTEVVTETETQVETDNWGQIKVKNEIPDSLDYGGKEVHILLRSGEAYRREWNTENPDDALDQEIFYRNEAVEEYLGVKLDFVISDEGSGLSIINQKILNTGKSAQGGIDIVNNYRNGAANTNLIPFYVDVRSDKFTYLNLDQPYWSQNFNEAANTYGRQYFFVGDLNLSLYDRAIVTFFNKAKVEPYLDMTVDELYDVVLDGDWTIEYLNQITKYIHEDYNGDGKTEDDFVGIASIWVSEASDGLLYSWDLKLTEMQSDGTHRVVTGADREKMITAFDKLTELYYGPGGYLHVGSNMTMPNCRHFVTGHSVFNIDTLYHHDETQALLSEMQDGYGVLPLPKYDEAQDRYLSGVQDAHNAMSVMFYGMTNYEMISAVLEYTCAKSYEQVRPFYVETIVKGQRMDAKSGQCFELIMDGVTMDFSDIYVPTIRATLWRNPFKTYESGGTVANAFVQNESTLNGKLGDIDTWLATNY